MKKDHYTLSTERWTQGNLIDDLKERITTLEYKVLQLQRKQTNESSYLGKRTPEVDSPIPLEKKIPDISSSQDLVQRIDKLVKKNNTSYSGFDLKRKSKK